MVARERRIDFLLDQLVEIAVLLPNRAHQGNLAYLHTRLRLIPEEDLPLPRAMIFHGEGSKELLADLVQLEHFPFSDSPHPDGRSMYNHCEDEIIALVTRLRDERDLPARRPSTSRQVRVDGHLLGPPPFRGAPFADVSRRAGSLRAGAWCA
jgi:hypothetical protein